jgi:RNA recognition motif-containing protein
MRIFVGNLPWTTTGEELSHLFEPYGIVEGAHIVTNHGSGRSQGFGFVEMPNATEANAAITGLQGAMLGGRVLTVSEARHREDRNRAQRPREERRPRW